MRYFLWKYSQSNREISLAPCRSAPSALFANLKSPLTVRNTTGKRDRFPARHVVIENTFSSYFIIEIRSLRTTMFHGEVQWFLCLVDFERSILDALIAACVCVCVWLSICYLVTFIIVNILDLFTYIFVLFITTSSTGKFGVPSMVHEIR